MQWARLEAHRAGARLECLAAMNPGCIETITDSRIAVDRFVATRPDLVVLALRMPFLSGLEVLEALLPIIGAEEYLPILILTPETLPRRGRPRSRWAPGTSSDRPFDAIEVLLRIRNLLETRFLFLEPRDENALLDRTVRERASSRSRSSKPSHASRWPRNSRRPDRRAHASCQRGVRADRQGLGRRPKSP